MTWRLAKSIEKFIAQQNEAAPKRSKASDGTIGDAAHASRSSDHNPKSGVVTAFDDTQDPKHGADMAALAERLRQSQDKRIAYVIFDHRIFDGTLKSGTGGGGVKPWTWRPYDGDPHTNHLHLSVAWSLKDNAAPWSCFSDEEPGHLSAESRQGAQEILGHLQHRRHRVDLVSDRRLLRSLRDAIDKTLKR